MNSVQKSIVFHRKGFNSLCVLIFFFLVVALVFFFSGEKNHIFGYVSLAFAIWTIVPANSSYQNVRFLENMNHSIDIPDGFIFIKN